MLRFLKSKLAKKKQVAEVIDNNDGQTPRITRWGGPTIWQLNCEKERPDNCEEMKKWFSEGGCASKIPEEFKKNTLKNCLKGERRSKITEKCRQKKEKGCCRQKKICKPKEPCCGKCKKCDKPSNNCGENSCFNMFLL